MAHCLSNQCYSSGSNTHQILCGINSVLLQFVKIICKPRAYTETLIEQHEKRREKRKRECGQIEMPCWIANQESGRTRSRRRHHAFVGVALLPLAHWCLVVDCVWCPVFILLTTPLLADGVSDALVVVGGGGVDIITGDRLEPDGVVCRLWCCW